MKCSSFAMWMCGTAAVVCGSVLADNLYWKPTTGTNSWNEASNWGVGSVNGAAKAPTVGDKIFLQTASGLTYVMRFDADSEMYQFGDLGGAKVGFCPTFDLNGHSLTVKFDNSNGCMMNFSQYNEETEERIPRGNEFIFKDGTLICTNSCYGPLLGNHGGKNSGGLIFDNATYYGNVHLDDNSRMVFKNGSVWHFTTKGSSNPASIDIPYSQGYIRFGGYVEVSGAGSLITGCDGKRYTCNVLSDRHALYVEDGGRAEFTDLKIGSASAASANSSVQLTDGTVDLTGSLYVGLSHTSTTGNYLRVAGAASLVTAAGDLCVYENTGSSIRFEVPVTGFTNAVGELRAPLQVRNALSVARTGGYPDNGAFRVRVRARTYFETHPDTMLPLIRLTTPNKAALEALAATAEFEDFLPAEYTAAAALVVNDEGTLLSLYAPPANTEVTAPEFTVSYVSTKDTGRTDFDLSVVTFGNRAESLTSVTCEFSVAGDWSDTVVSNWDGAVSGTTPLALSYAVDGLPEHRMARARITLVNDKALSETVELTFDTPGVSQIFTRKSNATDDTWETLSNWSERPASDNNTGHNVAATHEPREEDAIVFDSLGKTFTIRLDGDRAVSRINQTVGGWDVNTTSLYLFDLNGHTLDFLMDSSGLAFFPSGYSATQADFEYQRSTIEFRNGTVNCPNCGFRLGNGGYPTGGGLVLSQGAVLNSKIVACCNGSRIIVKEGSTWNVGAGGCSFNVNGSGGYGFLCVTGANSRVICPDTIYFNVPHTGAYALDGGYLQTYGLSIGATSSATNTFIDARNGTIKITTVLNFGGGGIQICPYPEIRVAGEHGFIQIPLCYYYPGTGGRFVYTVPEDGFKDDNGNARAPIQFTEMRSSGRSVGYPDLGPTKLEIAPKAWFEKHPRETIPLLRLTVNANAAELASLKANVIWTGVHPSSFPAGFDPLTVSADGKLLSLTAPPISGLAVILR